MSAVPEPTEKFLLHNVHTRDEFGAFSRDRGKISKISKIFNFARGDELRCLELFQDCVALKQDIGMRRRLIPDYQRENLHQNAVRLYEILSNSKDPEIRAQAEAASKPFRSGPENFKRKQLSNEFAPPPPEINNPLRMASVKTCSHATDALHEGGPDYIIDFSYADGGIAYVSDFTGHNKLKEKREGVMLEFNERLGQLARKGNTTTDEVKSEIYNLNEAAERRAGAGATLSLVRVVEDRGYKFALITNIGDSKVYILDQSGRIKYKTSNANSGFELTGNLPKPLKEESVFVEDTDIILIVSDGVLDFMSDFFIAQEATKAKGDARLFLANCKARIQKDQGDGEKTFSKASDSDKDDLGAAIIIV